MFKKKVLMLAAVGVVALPVTVNAVTTNIDVTAQFRQAIALNATDMDFTNSGADYISFSTPLAGTDTVQLGTDGSIAYNGSFSGPATGVPGTVEVTAGTNGETIEIFCDSTATMGDGSGEEISLNVKVAEEGATGTYAAAGSVCNGIAGAAATSLVLSATDDTFFFGGEIDGSTASAGFAGGTYSTATGGDNIEIDVQYQ